MRNIALALLLLLTACVTTEHSFYAPIGPNKIRLSCDEAIRLSQAGEYGIRQLSRALLSSDMQTRQYAGFALTDIGYVSLPAFIPALKSSDSTFYLNAQLAITLMVTHGKATSEQVVAILDRIESIEPSLAQRIGETKIMIDRYSEREEAKDANQPVNTTAVSAPH